MSGEGAPYVCSLNSKLQKKAEKELNEKASKRDRDIQALRDMVKAHPALKCPTDAAFLLKFLRARKFNLDQAYTLILAYYTVKAENPDIFDDAIPSKCQHLMDAQIMTILPNKDKNGCRIGFFRPGKWDPEKITEREIVKFNMLQLEKIIKDEETQVNGMVFVADFSGMTLNHVKHIQKENAHMMPVILQDAFPLRIKAAYLCKEPGIFGMVWAIIQPFLKEKLAKRVNLIGNDLKKLHAAVGVENLPEELGGTLGPADDIANAWYNEVKKDEESYVQMLQYNIELVKPITKKKNEDVVDSLMGNYKKLNVD